MAEGSLDAGLFDVVGIGNAIVDVLAHAEEGFLAQHGLNKGTMTLIDAAAGDGALWRHGSGDRGLRRLRRQYHRRARLAWAAGPAISASWAPTSWAGIFRHDIRANGVAFETPVTTSATPTARCLIFVTPDAQRTMNTYLGACIELSPEDIDPAMIGRAKVTYLEGYLWDPPAAKQAFLKAAKIAHEAGRKVALSLSDPFCVDRHRDEFRDLLRDHVDILFANEAEICSLWQVDSFDAGPGADPRPLRDRRADPSAKGSLVLSGAETHMIEAAPVARVVDTTGAGDLYAAGFLHGYCRGLPATDCGRYASLAAAEAISHFGARPERPLAQLLLTDS